MCLRQNRVAAAITQITAQWASAHLRPDLSSPIAFAHRSCLEGRVSQAQIHWFLFSLSRFAYWCLTGISAEFGPVCQERNTWRSVCLPIGDLRFQPFPRPLDEKSAVVFMMQRFLLYYSEGTLISKCNYKFCCMYHGNVDASCCMMHLL